VADGRQGLSFADYLKTLRERRRYSKSALARRADIDATYLGRIERGLLPPPRPKNLARLAAALGLTDEERAVFLDLSGRADTSAVPLDQAAPTHPAPLPTDATSQPSGDLPVSRPRKTRPSNDDEIGMILEAVAGLQKQVAHLLLSREDRDPTDLGQALLAQDVLASVEAILTPRSPVNLDTPAHESETGTNFGARGQLLGEVRELHGQREVLDTIITLISSVPPLSAPHSREILLATHWIDDLFEATPYLCQEFWAALEAALHREWDVVHLMALDGDRGQSTAWIRDMIGLLGMPGQYRPHYFERNTPPPLPFSFLLVPGIAALQLVATPGHRQVNSALLYPGYLSEGGALGELFSSLREHSRPLLHTHCGRSSWGPTSNEAAQRAEMEARYAALLAAEGQDGERLSIWPNFSMPTIPPECLARQTCRRYGVDHVSALPPAIRNTLDLMQRRHLKFRQAVRSKRYRSICDRSVVERFLRDGQYRVDHPLLESATVPERVDHLRTLLALLRETRYEVALADESPPHLFHTGLQVMATAQGGSAFLFGWRLSGRWQDTRVDSEITEPGVVKDFRLYFENAWSQLPPRCTNKALVIAWLEDQLKGLLAE
jgi:transcriptional regulator with XRE-family HTH domain